VERHEAGATVYWRSYDFAGNTGQQNLFAHPLGPGDDSGFVHDGGEIIFSLPNGLQAYLLVDAQGRRIDKGPTAIVSDPRRPDRAVENGISCMSCHARGIIEKNDQVRAHVLRSPKAFSPSVVETVQALYPAAEKMTALMRADARRFQEAVAKTGAPLSATEPVHALAIRFESELDLPLAAAEAGVTPAELLKALDRYPSLAKSLGPLRVEGGTVQRTVFVDSFPELVDALAVANHVPSRSVVCDRLIRRGDRLLESNATAALEAFAKALELEPDNALAHAGSGDVHRLRGDFAQALAAYSEALRRAPRLAQVFNNRGLVFHKQGEQDKALADFSSALRFEPRLAAAYHNRGVAHFAKGELDKAIADYTEALQLEPKSALVLNNRGYAFLEKDDPERALADFNAALKLEPKFTAALNNRGLVHLRQGRLSQAVADFTAVIDLDSTFARAYFNRAIAFMRQGNNARADADRKKALQFDPSLDRD
jgi:tetratricopeptide (TPR) repeat protein